MANTSGEVTGLYAAEWAELYELGYTDEDVTYWLFDGVVEAYECGCSVEPDGTCPCGNPSWLIKLGIV